MTRKRVFLAALLAVASLGAVAQTSTSARPASGQENQISIQQKSAATSAPQNGAAPVLQAQNTNPGASSAPSTGQSNVGAEGAALNNGQLPQTSTILPLLGLIGLGSLVAGFFSKR